MLKVNVIQGAVEGHDDELVVVSLFEGATAPSGATAAVDLAMGGRIRRLIGDGDFKGKLGETIVLYGEGELKARRVLLIGLGKPDDLSLETVRHVAAVAAQKSRDLRVPHFSSVVHGAGAGGITAEDAAEALVIGTSLGLYRYTEHKTHDDDAARDAGPAGLTLVEFDGTKVSSLEAGAMRGGIVAEATILARDLVNAPANYLTPATFAERAMAVARETGLSCHVLEREQLEELGMGAFLAVNQGSAHPPKMVVLQHQSVEGAAPIVLVGKGITFDSGGISLKPWENMHAMKSDMAGGAAVLGALQAVARLHLPKNVIGLIPLAENLPSGTAFRPGDVLVSMAGITIEVKSTDAEGRLILADALAYAKRYSPAAVIDLATLTGACVVALGHVTTGLFSTDEGLSTKIKDAGLACGERMWPMPLFKEYGEQLKSDVADLSNVGGRPAGAITAAAFLSRFADGYPWAHLDIAGTSWLEKQSTPYLPAGATGVGVALFTKLLQTW